MRKSLALITRLERQRVAESRQVLSQIDAAIAACDHAAKSLLAELNQGFASAWPLPDGPRLVAAYVARLRLELDEIARRRRALEESRAAAAALLQDRILATKSLETAVDRLGKLAATEEARRHTAAVDEAAMLRHVYPRR